MTATISEFIDHYHLERNHQGLDNRLVAAITTSPTTTLIPLVRSLVANVSVAC
jgi:hypothetical protein